MAQNQRQQLWQRDRRRRNKKGRKAKKRGGKGKGNMYTISDLSDVLKISLVAHTPPAVDCWWLIHHQQLTAGGSYTTCS
jgi:hypothetical protein